jgi:hypothetical protein
MIFIVALLNFSPWLYALKMDSDLDLKCQQTITNIVDYPINFENENYVEILVDGYVVICNDLKRATLLGYFICQVPPCFSLGPRLRPGSHMIRFACTLRASQKDYFNFPLERINMLLR